MRVTACEDRPVLNSCALEDIQYQVDPYIGCEHYCYYCYALNQAETDWSEEVKYHQDIAGKLTRELSDIAPQVIYMGDKTDPYHPCEAEYKQTQQVLEVLFKGGYSASILTKSDLVLRDMDLIKAMDSSAVGASVAFVDDDVLFNREHPYWSDIRSELVEVKEKLQPDLKIHV